MADIVLLGDPWEQLANEPSDKFLLFRQYLTMQPRRLSSLASLSGLSSASLADYKQDYKWDARCDAFDRYMAEKEKEEYERTIKETCARHAKLAENLQSILMIPAKVFADKLKDIGEVELREMHTSDLLAHVYQAAKLVKPLIEVERLSKGLSTENVAVKQSLKEQIQINITPSTTIPKNEDNN